MNLSYLVKYYNSCVICHSFNPRLTFCRLKDEVEERKKIQVSYNRVPVSSPGVAYVCVYEKEEICARQVFSDPKRSQPDDPDHSEKTTDCNFLFNNLKRGSVMKIP